MNQLYIETFGKKAFNESIDTISYFDNRKEAYNKREWRLRERAYTQLYPKWKAEYKEYTELCTKENKERDDAANKLYSVILFCGLCAYLLSFRRPQKINNQARSLVIYNITCEAVNIIIVLLPFVLDKEITNDLYLIFAALFLPSLIINPSMISYLSPKSGKERKPYFLIPQWVRNTNAFNSEVSKRLLSVFILYPLFYLVPIPYVGCYVFVIYIIPMSIIFTILSIIAWIFKGRNIDKISRKPRDKEKAKIYCRYCGNLIDADSKYCTHCGKKQ